MYFNVSADDGHRITGYLVPDSFSGVSAIRIAHGTEEVLHQASEAIPGLVSIGRHATGICGFSIDESVIPNLREIRDLEIYESETGLRLYRRRPPQAQIQAKILRLETHLAPLGALDQVFEPQFHFFYKSIEQLGYETVTQIFQLLLADSAYVSGRLSFKTYEYFIDAGKFSTVCLLRDPYDELAERLLVFQQAGRDNSTALDVRDAMTFEAAVEFASALDLSDEKQLRRAFRNISAADAFVLSDPLVRTLGARTQNEIPQDSTIASALEVLSTFAVVGIRESADLFLESLAALLGVDMASLPPIAESETVTRLGRVLREISVVKGLIERDIQLYNDVKAALAKAL